MRGAASGVEPGEGQGQLEEEARRRAKGGWLLGGVHNCLIRSEGSGIEFRLGSRLEVA